MAVAVRRRYAPRQIMGELLAAEINESEAGAATGSRPRRTARSVKYQISIAKLPDTREIEEFTFDDTPINDTLVYDLADGWRHRDLFDLTV